MIKKLISFAAAAAIAANGVAVSAAGKKVGDINGDGKVNITDLSKLAAHVKSVKLLDSSSMTRADINGDGRVNITDLSHLAAQVKGVSASSGGALTEEQFAEEVARLVNKERSARGLSALVYSPELCRAADIRVKEIVDVWGHTRPNGTAFYTVLDEVGVSLSSARENIADGYVSPSDVMSGFMGSDIHRNNILSTDVKYVGISVYKKGSSYYCVQIFADGRGMSGKVV